MTRRVDWIAHGGGPLCGDVMIPGDKSISHRALLLAAIAEGQSTIHGFLEGTDTICTANALQQLGVRIDRPGIGQRVVHGVGLQGLRAPATALDCGNSGTGMRLLAGLLAGQAFDSELLGDTSLSQRPMGRIIEPLARMGARMGSASGGLPPLRIAGGQSLHGVSHIAPVASAQVKSALLLAGLYARGETEVVEPQPTRDYTERMLAAFGWPIEYAPGHARLRGGYCLQATAIAVPADFSSAAFFMVAASIVPGSCICMPEVGLNPRRTGLLHALRLMGADIEVEPLPSAGEARGNIIIRHAPLHGVEIPRSLVADMIDEFPALFIAAATATGTTRIRGAAELRVKESDRLSVMAAALQVLGVGAHEVGDGIDIIGRGGALKGGGAVDSQGDHRIAMSLAVAGQVAGSSIRIQDCAAVATSFPGFTGTASGAGMSLCEAVR